MIGKLRDLSRMSKDYPERASTLNFYQKVLDNTVYDGIRHEFHEEGGTGGDAYRTIADRRPSVHYSLCKIVVDETVAMLFGENRFPAFQCLDTDVRDKVKLIVKAVGLEAVMERAAMIGSVGSVALHMQVWQARRLPAGQYRAFVTALETRYLSPEWDPQAPDTLARVTEAYITKGAALRAMGFAIPQTEDQADYWFMREWNEEQEVWFEPQTRQDRSDGKRPVPNARMTVTHGLGFVPMVWIKNLASIDPIDGACTFVQAISTGIEIDYTLSQAGRGLRYNCNPLVVVKNGQLGEGGSDDISRSAATILEINGENADAKMLEITGGAADAIEKYVRLLRELALESIHGNRTAPDKLATAQSGRAMELLHAPLISLVDRLRHSYGPALLAMQRMLVQANAKFPLTYLGQVIGEIDQKVETYLQWGRFFAPTHVDQNQDAQTMQMLRESGNISQESAVILTAETWGIDDARAELVKVQADEERADARAVAVKAMIQARETLPG